MHYKRSLIVVCLAVLIAAGVLLPRLAYADEPATQYNELREYYLRITRLDPEVAKPKLWERAADSLTAFFNKRADEDYSARSAYLLGRLYEYIYRQKNDQAALGRSLYFYERLVDDYPDHRLADDALLLAGDLYQEGEGNADAAIAAYQRILNDYPDSDSAKKAESKIPAGRAVAARPERSKASAEHQRAAPTRSAASDAPASPTPAKEPPRLAEAANTASSEKKGFFATLFGGKKLPNNDGDEQQGESAEPKPDDLQPLPIAARFPRRPVIVIDPGHGGEEEGAHGVEGVFEKDIVLRISMMLDELLRKRLKAKTVLTRVDDSTVELSERTKIANDNNADLFISIHANASFSKRAKGIETYYLDNTNDASSLRLAKRENASIGKDLDDLGFIISDLIQNAKLDDSITLAHHIQDELYKGISKVYPDVKDLGVKKAPFYVLVGAHMPCVLVEVSFIDHSVEGRRLITPEYQRLVADSIFDGVVSYFQSAWDL